LEASASEVRRRLVGRGDIGLDPSIKYNREIAQAIRSKFVSLVIDTNGKRVENVVEEIRKYCEVARAS
jgi:hypothetical protein